VLVASHTETPLRPKQLVLRYLLLCVVLLLSAPVGAAVQSESPGTVESLPQPFHAHWVGVADLVLARMAFLDLDDGRFLGIVNGGYGTIMPLFPARRQEMYVPATYYARRTHGERTDVVEIYDTRTLALLGEIVIPPRRATNAVALAHAALSDDDRFVAVFNWTTGTSLSIVDAEKRLFTEEVLTPGCSLAYAAGPRRFFSLCGDGSLFTVTLDDAGHEMNKTRSEPFFDPRKDPVTEKAVRYGNDWLFVSFDSQVYSVDVAAPAIKFDAPWPLLTDADRAESWRTGGLQHLAVHRKSGRLYVLMHRGGADTHKEYGEQIWVYDLASHRRIDRLKLVNPGLTIYGFPVDFGRTWPWPFSHTSDWMLNTFAPAAINSIQVTQDDAPLLFTSSQFSGSIGVYNALSGAFMRRVGPTGWTSDVMLAPWDGTPRQ
jgi:methylamine dehydrogenase heavy chain